MSLGVSAYVYRRGKKEKGRYRMKERYIKKKKKGNLIAMERNERFLSIQDAKCKFVLTFITFDENVTRVFFTTLSRYQRWIVGLTVRTG